LIAVRLVVFRVIKQALIVFHHHLHHHLPAILLRIKPVYHHQTLALKTQLQRDVHQLLIHVRKIQLQRDVHHLQNKRRRWRKMRM
jgi:hypothetical protein